MSILHPRPEPRRPDPGNVSPRQYPAPDMLDPPDVSMFRPETIGRASIRWTPDEWATFTVGALTGVVVTFLLVLAAILAGAHG